MLAILALALLAWLAWLRFAAGYPAPARELAVLRRDEAACLAAAGDTLFPPGGAVPASGGDADVAGYVDDLVVRMPARQRRLIRLLTFLVEHGTALFPAPGHGLRGLRRFSALEPAAREAALEDWRTSGLFPRRLVFMSLRALLTLGYFAHPPVPRALGLAPFAIEPPLCEADLLYPPIGASRRTLSRTPADLAAPPVARPLGPDAPREGPRRPARDGTRPA